MVSYFARLTERGFLRMEQSGGKARHFYPLISRDQYLQMETASLMHQYHFKSPYGCLLAGVLRLLSNAQGHGRKLRPSDCPIRPEGAVLYRFFKPSMRHI